MILTPYLLTILGAYLLGCSNMALYVSRARGVDLRSGGSGNLGAANTMTLMGWKYAVLVGAHDIGKAVLAVVLARRLFPGAEYVGFVAGVSCVLGHMYPFYLRFRGGKGFASYLGMILALNWRFALIVMAGVLLLTLITDYIVVGTVFSVVSYPVYTAIRSGWLPMGILCVATLAILYKHRQNYVRIWNGTEIGLLRASRGKYRVK